MHCEHKYKRTVENLFTCKLCGKVVYKSKKVLTKEKHERSQNRDNR